jgi:hypothetical protein
MSNNRLTLERVLLRLGCEVTEHEWRTGFPLENPSRVLAVTKRGGIRREELVGERSRKEGKNATNTTYRELVNKANFMPREYYECDEDWLVTCPDCHGDGTIGKGISGKR